MVNAQCNAVSSDHRLRNQKGDRSVQREQELILPAVKQLKSNVNTIRSVITNVWPDFSFSIGFQLIFSLFAGF